MEGGNTTKFALSVKVSGYTVACAGGSGIK